MCIIIIIFKSLVLKIHILSALEVWQQKILFWIYYICPLVFDPSKHVPILVILFLAVYVKIDKIRHFLSPSRLTN